MITDKRKARIKRLVENQLPDHLGYVVLICKAGVNEDGDKVEVITSATMESVSALIKAIAKTL